MRSSSDKKWLHFSIITLIASSTSVSADRAPVDSTETIGERREKEHYYYYYQFLNLCTESVHGSTKTSQIIPYENIARMKSNGW